MTASSSGLSAQQNEAFSAPFDKSAVVLAGAGAGKTKLLTERVVRLLQIGANPSRVAVVTFTRKAANEMSSRILSRLGDKRRLPVIGTVHALAMSVAARRRMATNLASVEQERECLGPLKDLLPPELESLSDEELLLATGRAREAGDTTSTLGMLGLVYEEELRKRGLADFTLLLSLAASKTQDLFDHVLVDEAQDLSELQLNFLRAIAPRAMFWYIGDADQSIYSFRGSYATMMHRLIAESDLKFVLDVNFRSSRKVVTHANNVIKQNPDRLEVTWTPFRTDTGDVSVVFNEHGDDEVLYAAEWLGENRGNRCVLARTQALVAPLKAENLNAMTVHESKGLEWDEVLVIGCEAAVFPHPLASVEEERRLFYVAMTRARDNLSLSYTASRASKNPMLATRSPSRFLFETQALRAKT